MAQNTPKRKIKDSVFTNLFQDKKYLLRLYKALHPEDSNVTEEDIKDVTIKHILVDADYNDLGFSIGGRLVILVESQSTWTLNIIIRALMYLIQTYHDFFKRTRQNLYGSKKVNMPKPELYVIFTGEKPKNPPDIISLSKDFFNGEKYLESKEQEVVDIMMTLFDDEQVLEAYAEDIKNSEARETAERMIRKGKMSLEEIADYVPSLSLEELKELEAAIMQLV